MKRTAIAAIALLAVVMAIVGWRTATADDVPAPASKPRQTASATVAAPGHRLVGRGRSVVQVPQGWGTNKTKCGTPVADTVSFHSEVVDLCRITPLDNFSVVEIASYGAPFSPEDTKSSDGFYRKAFANKSDDARIFVSTTDKAIFDQIVASYGRLPAAWTTVPDLFLGFSGGRPGVDAVPNDSERSKRLARFGLKGQITILDLKNPTGGPDTADPTAGTSVHRGSTVTITTGH